MAADFPFQAGTEQGVDQGVNRMDPVQGQNRVGQGEHLLRMVEHLVRQPQPFEENKVVGRIALELFRIEQEKDKGKCAESVHRPGNH